MGGFSGYGLPYHSLIYSYHSWPLAPCDRNISTCVEENPILRIPPFRKASITGCPQPDSYADGICDDENNNEACFFDGGDCCISDVQTTFCTQCKCLNGEGLDGV